MAFGAEELRVLRRALAFALYPRPASPDDVQDFLRLAESVDEVVQEGARRHAFLLADLARYRAALPGSATGYYRLLEEALVAGHRPGFDDMAALRALSGNPAAAALLARCNALPDRTGAQDRPGTASTPARPGAGAPRIPAAATDSPHPVDAGAADGAGTGAGVRVGSGGRVRLLALPGGLLDDPRVRSLADEDDGDEKRDPSGSPDSPEKPGKEREHPSPSPQRPVPPSEPGRQEPKPGRPIPTPGEVFPKRKPGAQPPSGPARQRLAAV